MLPEVPLPGLRHPTAAMSSPGVSGRALPRYIATTALRRLSRSAISSSASRRADSSVICLSRSADDSGQSIGAPVARSSSRASSPHGSAPIRSKVDCAEVSSDCASWSRFWRRSQEPYASSTFARAYGQRDRSCRSAAR